MDLQTDRNWIISELQNVQDPHLIEAFKQLLAYRRTTRPVSEPGASLDKAIEDKKQDRVKPHSEVRTKYEKWL